MGNSSAKAKYRKETKTHPHSKHFVLGLPSFDIINYSTSFGEFEVLPVETLIHVMSYLDYQDILSFSAVSKAFFLIGGDDCLWKELYQKRTWYYKFISEESEKFCCWKGAFLSRISSLQEQKSSRAERLRRLEVEIDKLLDLRDKDRNNERIRYQTQLEQVSSYRIAAAVTIWVALFYNLWTSQLDLVFYLSGVMAATYLAFKRLESLEKFNSDAVVALHHSNCLKIEQKWSSQIDPLKLNLKKIQMEMLEADKENRSSKRWIW